MNDGLAMIKKFLYLLLAALFCSAPVIFAEGEEEAPVKKTLPVGADLYLSNNIGAGTIAKAYQQDPYLASSFYLYPYYKIGPFLNERELRFHGELSSSLEWMGKKNPISADFFNKFSLGDLKLRAELKKAINAKSAGLTISPTFEVEAPLAKGSRVANRILGIGGYVTATWSQWGFFFTYKPNAIAYVHSVNYKSDDCGDENTDADKVGDGQCKAAGRQTMVLWKNGFFTGYQQGNHTLTLGFRTYHSFLRDAGQGEKPDKEKGSDILESTLGLLEYAYNFSTDFPTTLYVGVSGFQSPYDANGKFRMPFFSFSEPSKNVTEAYVAVNVSI